MGNDGLKTRAEYLAREAGMQFDARYSHWVAARGKFEGEQWYAPYYWDQTLNGDGDRIFPDDSDEFDTCGSIFETTADECEVFEFDQGTVILVREDSQGFVFVTSHKSRDEAEAKFREWIGD